MSVFIIAEAGVNHNGSIELAFKLVDAAVEAGVDAVKFQTFKAKNHYSKSATPKTELYEGDLYDLIEKLEIDRSWHEKLAEICNNLNIDFLDSVGSEVTKIYNTYIF